MAIYNREDPRTALPQLEKQLHGEIEKLSTDYVVEQGESGVWTYRKWKSGIVECWGVMEVSSATWLTYLSTGLYYSNPQVTFGYPFIIYSARPFVEIRTVGSNVGWVANISSSNDGFGVTVVRNGNTGSVSVWADVKGRWK